MKKLLSILFFASTTFTSFGQMITNKGKVIDTVLAGSSFNIASQYQLIKVRDSLGNLIDNSADDVLLKMNKSDSSGNSGFLTNFRSDTTRSAMLIRVAAKQAVLSGTGLLSFSGSTATYNSTSSGIASILSDETGTGNIVFNTSPLFNTSFSVQGVAATDGPTLSSEFLPTSGFTSTGWTIVTGNTYTHSIGNTSVLSQNTAAGNATKYHIVITITSRTAGTINVSFGSQSTGAISASTNFGPTTTSTAGLQITPTTDFDGTVQVSIKSITAGSTSLINYYSSGSNLLNEIRGSSIYTNMFSGIGAGKNTTTGHSNVAMGDSALLQNTTGFFNTAIGLYALRSNTVGQMNVALGGNTLLLNTVGSNNLAIAFQALTANTSGLDNIAIGVNALLGNTIANDNTAIGYNAGRSITTGGTNTFVGSSSGYAGGGLQLNNAINSTAIGYNTYTTASNQVVIGNASITTGGVGVVSPTAVWEIKGGTLTNPTLKINFAQKTTTPVTGAIEYDTTELNFTNNSLVRGSLITVRLLSSAAGTLTLDKLYTHYVFTGSTTTWTLPAVANSANHIFYIKNRGSGTITLNTAAAANELYTTSAVSTLAITAGSAYMILSDGTYWNVE